ncbi:TonB family protein [Parvularcula flava]|uniref:TonB family protein n=1 Tax=Aquisalinus luteolus TaxID=1566827 RepID=A0A8J3A4N9_9PROT|nr:TonB family protein [Aquisalinus luteolus]NHK28394.1 TonB family protein [Aquisalinus luteolus]GGH98343.1 hypothetical protein GCM10011355_21710 [Aquisalinus luteolus]
MRKFLLAATAVIGLGGAMAVMPGNAAWAQSYSSYGQAYKAFNESLGEGDREGAISAGKQAWQMAEAAHSDDPASVNKETLAVLAQNYAFVALWDKPRDAINPAERALALGREGYGLASFSLEELEIMVATAKVLDDPDGPDRRAFIDAMNAWWASGGEATSLVASAGMKAAGIILERGAYGDVLQITKPLGEALSRLPNPPAQDIANTNIIRVAAMMTNSEIFRPTMQRSARGQSLEGATEPNKLRRRRTLAEATQLLAITRSFFDTQESIDDFDPTLAQVMAWQQLVRAYANTNTVTDIDDYEFEWNGTRRTVKPALTKTCFAPEPRYTKRPSPDYPISAAYNERGGSIIVGYHLDENGKVYGAKVLAGVPEERFGRNTLRAVEKWEADVEGLSEACRMNNITQFTFSISMF